MGSKEVLVDRVASLCEVVERETGYILSVHNMVLNLRRRNDTQTNFKRLDPSILSSCCQHHTLYP
jgi:hypothetical protein